jgi:multidrug efflux system outer membrane protein
MAQSDLKLAHLEKSIVDHQWIPELQFYYIHSEEEFFGGNKVDVFGLGLEIPIFDMGRNRRALASANLRTMELKTKQTQLINYTQKQRLIQDVSLALKALGVYTEQKIEARERAFERASRHFKKGQIDAQSFLDFEHEAHAGRAQRFQHQLALLKGLVELTALSGEETLLLDIFQ